jgi:hypothetical protein
VNLKCRGKQRDRKANGGEQAETQTNKDRRRQSQTESERAGQRQTEPDRVRRTANSGKGRKVVDRCREMEKI